MTSINHIFKTAKKFREIFKKLLTNQLSCGIITKLSQKQHRKCGPLAQLVRATGS